MESQLPAYLGNTFYWSPFSLPHGIFVKVIAGPVLGSSVAHLWANGIKVLMLTLTSADKTAPLSTVLVQLYKKLERETRILMPS